MVKQAVDLATALDPETGDSARTAFDKVNDNFDEVYSSFVSVLHHGAVGDGITDDTAAVQAAVDAAIATQASASALGGLVLFPAGHEYLIEDINIDSETVPITVFAYGARLNVTGTSTSGFNIANLRCTFLGGQFGSPSGTTTTAINITQTATSSALGQCTIQDVTVINMYKGIVSYMDKATYPGTVNYRHIIQNCRIINTTNGTKAWAGSQGIYLDGDTVNDSSGNVSKIVNCTANGIETGIYTNGIATRISNTEVEGNKYGIQVDGAFCQINNLYSESNDTGIDITANGVGTKIDGWTHADTSELADAGSDTQISYTEPGINLLQQSAITPTGNSTALTVNAGSSATPPMAEFVGTGEVEITKSGAVHATAEATGSSYFGTGTHEFRNNSAGESGVPIIFMQGSTGSSVQVRPVSGTQGNGAAFCLRLPKDNATSRSINAGGTVNVNAADFAEYMRKAIIDEIKKGDIVGINSDGQLTNIFDDAIHFMVKSTDPGYVGGDAWGSEDVVGPEPQIGMKAPKEPEEPLGRTDARSKADADMYKAETNKYETAIKAYKKRLKQYNAEMAVFKEKLEVERVKYDRIAFCGQVPVNLYGAKPGDWIIPVKEKTSGAVGDVANIGGKAVSDPTFEEFKLAVGKVIAIEDDGRAQIIVKSV